MELGEKYNCDNLSLRVSLPLHIKRDFLSDGNIVNAENAPHGSLFEIN